MNELINCKRYMNPEVNEYRMNRYESLSTCICKYMNEPLGNMKRHLSKFEAKI